MVASTAERMASLATNRVRCDLLVVALLAHAESMEEAGGRLGTAASIHQPDQVVDFANEALRDLESSAERTHNAVKGGVSYKVLRTPYSVLRTRYSSGSSGSALSGRQAACRMLHPVRTYLTGKLRYCPLRDGNEPAPAQLEGRGRRGRRRRRPSHAVYYEWDAPFFCGETLLSPETGMRAR